MSQIELAVVHSEPLNRQVQKVILKPSAPLRFRAGQYMAVSVEADDCRYYSIASPEMQSELIELHIESTNSTQNGLKKLLTHKRARLIKVGGKAILRRESCAPLLLVAGGVGFSYVRSILLSSLSLSPNREVHVYWVGRNQSQLYALDELRELVKKHSNFKLTTVVKADESDRGVDILTDALKRQYKTLSDMEVYIAGRFDTSLVLREQLKSDLGATPKNIISDAFS